MGVYDTSGAIRVTVSDGVGFKGLYAADGSWYVTVAPGDVFVGSRAPDGSLYVTVSPGNLPVGMTAPDGSLYVTEDLTEWSGAQRVVVVSGTLEDDIAALLFASSEQGVWYDPSDLSTMYQDSAGTTPVTAAGQPVGRINDKSGNGFHATQSTSASRPTLQQTAGGLWYLDFDGVDDGLVTSSIDFTGTANMTVFAGVTKEDDATTAIIVELGSGGLANSFYVAGPVNAGQNEYAVRVGGDTGNNIRYYRPYVAPTTNVLSASLTTVAADSDASQDVRIDGVSLSGTQQASVLTTGNFGNYPLYIGRRPSTLPFDGRMFSLIVRGAATDAATIAQVESLVNAKTGAY